MEIHANLRPNFFKYGRNVGLKHYETPPTENKIEIMLVVVRKMIGGVAMLLLGGWARFETS